MTLEILSDVDYKYFEVTTKDKKIAGYPTAIMNRWGTGWTIPLDPKKNWWVQLEGIASYVNNELKDECLFAIG